MIINVRIKNFYSIREEAVLDFVALPCRRDCTDQRFIAYGDDKFVKVIGIFGGNAAGKSNIIKAIEWSRRFILNSHLNADNTRLDYSPFKFSKDEPTEFGIAFIADGVEYDYAFSLKDGQVFAESLYHYPNGRRAKVFDRKNENEYTFGKSVVARSGEVVASTGPQTLFLSRAASMHRDIASRVLNFFKEQITVGVPSYTDMNEIYENFDTYKPSILRALAVSDSDIADITVERGLDLKQRMVTYHKSDKTIPFDFMTEESDGTRRLVSVLIQLIHAINRGAVLLLDEFDLKLHLFLAEFLIDVVQSTSMVQMVFTSHNSNLINLEQLGAEQIVFVTKNSDGSSEFAVLSDYSGIGSNTDLQKAYLQGRFDAIPFIGNVSGLFDTTEAQ